LLISLARRFIFIANLKSASTAIENKLRNHCEIRLNDTHSGKHFSLIEIEARFAWIHTHIPRNQFFVFGVVRDPVGFVTSLYTSHRKPAFRGRPGYTGETDFAEFWARWPLDHRFRWMFETQTSRFSGPDGRLRVDYLVDHARLEEEWPGLCERCGVPLVPLDRANPSPPGFGATDVPPAIAEEIRSRYAVDLETLRTATGRTLR
jgi:hypothetical protein